MPTIKNIIIFVAIGTVFALIYFFYIKKSPEDEALLVSTSATSVVAETAITGENASVAQDFLTLLLSVKDIKLNDAILSDPAFLSLDGSHSITLVQDGTEGRPNPFAPLGAAVITADPKSATPPAQTVQTSPKISPKETYLKMRAEMDSVKTYADLEAITLKYGSKTQVEKINVNRAQINALPSAFKDQLATMAKNPASKDITTIQESISGNTATLNVSSTKPGFKGTITLVLENDKWKLELESWKQQ